MAGEVSSIGTKLYYAVESVAGTRPTALADYTELADVKEIPEQSLEPDGIEVTNLSDSTRRYVKGLADPGTSLGFLFNVTDTFLTAWDTTMYGAWETGAETDKKTWFAIVIPNLDQSYYVAGDPAKLGLNGIPVGEAVEAMGYIVPRQTDGWAAAPTTT